MERPESVDREIGTTADGHRRVQKWSYSAYPHPHRDGKLTPRGKVY